ncbi:hypothetical protein K3495_g9436 [Podosphaera aphanis]|nr:hypothetical protein K3495_g9436 [Podosphaera aphanis]
MVHLTSDSRASSPEPTIQIFIKDISGETIPMMVPANLSIQNLTTLLSVRMSCPESDLRLVHAGRHLIPPHTLSSYNIVRENTLHLASPLRGGMPSKKVRCSFKDCKGAAQRITGDCGFCIGHFCMKHRLLEDHKCEGLEDCKRESHERNAAQLHAERTRVIKGA